MYEEEEEEHEQEQAQEAEEDDGNEMVATTQVQHVCKTTHAHPAPATPAQYGIFTLTQREGKHAQHRLMCHVTRYQAMSASRVHGHISRQQ